MHPTALGSSRGSAHRHADVARVAHHVDNLDARGQRRRAVGRRGQPARQGRGRVAGQPVDAFVDVGVLWG
eukprot:4118158-Prymnesium_polylepis.1